MQRIPILLLLTICAVLPGYAYSPADLDHSLARHVPADVGFYIEAHDIGDVLLPLTEPQAWVTLAELAGQPANVQESAEWRARIYATVQMEPREAVQVLLAGQFAYVADAPGRAADAALLCRPTTPVAELIQRWNVRPLPTAGRISEYRLPSNVSLAKPEGYLVFGDATDAAGMFRRIVEHAEQNNRGSLADDPTYRRLLESVPAKPDAVLFARLGRPTPPMTSSQPAASQPTSAPSELPQLLRGSHSVLFALHREQSLLHFSAVGDGVRAAAPLGSEAGPIVAALPERTLAAWTGAFSYQHMRHAVLALPERSALRLAFQLQESSGALERLWDALDPGATIAIGVVMPQGRAVAAPPVPAVAVLVRAQDAPRAMAELDAMMSNTASLINLWVLKTGATALPRIEHRPIAGREARLLDLSGALQGRPGWEAIGELHVCWALDNDVLIVASHADWLRQILASRHGDERNLSRTIALSRRPVANDAETVVVAQTGPIADLATQWLNYMTEHAPAVLTEDWWRARQPGDEQPRLGIQVSEDNENGRLDVSSVTPNSPADGVLKRGDAIIGCNGQRFATTQPVGEMLSGLAKRPHARWVDVDIERDGATIARRIPLPFVYPIQMLQNLTAVGRITQRIVYHDDVGAQGAPRGFLTVELRPQNGPPLFQFPQQTGGRPAGDVPE